MLLPLRRAVPVLPAPAVSVAAPPVLRLDRGLSVTQAAAAELAASLLRGLLLPATRAHAPAVAVAACALAVRLGERAELCELRTDIAAAVFARAAMLMSGAKAAAAGAAVLTSEADAVDAGAAGSLAPCLLRALRWLPARLPVSPALTTLLQALVAACRADAVRGDRPLVSVPWRREKHLRGLLAMCAALVQHALAGAALRRAVNACPSVRHRLTLPRGASLRRQRRAGRASGASWPRCWNTSGCAALCSRLAMKPPVPLRRCARISWRACVVPCVLPALRK